MEYIAIISTAFQVMGALNSASDKSDQFKASQQQEQYNAALDRQRADAALSSSNQREEQHRRQVRLIQGKQRAAIAESGTGLGGTNADLEHQSELFAELDAMNIRYEGTLEARGLLADAEMRDSRADRYGRSAKNARTSGYLGAAGALLGGAGDYVRGTRKRTPEDDGQ